MAAIRIKLQVAIDNTIWNLISPDSRGEITRILKLDWYKLNKLSGKKLVMHSKC